jgi:hypothetical protein
MFGIYHVIFVDEVKTKDEIKEQLSKCLSPLSEFGIQEGVLSLNDDYRPMLDKIAKEMFPRHNLTEVILQLNTAGTT